MRIGILGPVEVTVSGRAVEVGGARLRALLTLLALEGGRPVPAERLIDALWEDAVPAAAPNALQSLVSRLRAAVGREHVESRPGGYRLAVPSGAVDAHDFEDRLRAARALADPAARAEALRAALALWRGPALADAAGLAFAEGPAARLEGLRQAALEERVDADLELGRHAELIPELEALAAADPLREPLRGRLIRALYAAGRQADALAEYAAVKRELADALGVDPSPDLEALHLSVLRQDPALRAAPPPSPRAGGNLPARLTSFVGREEDLTRVRKLLAEERLVTLVGPGGAGKTRLAWEAGERARDDAADGVWFVGLAPVDDPAEVPAAVLAAMRPREVPLLSAGHGALVAGEAADPLDLLAGALADRAVLLILDNCEHLLDAAARLADRLLADCPDARILATSREPLGITGETLWPVGPLALPPAAAGPREAMASPAVRLLADRAAAVAPGFAVTDANVGHVVCVCRSLDGMPLAIELAAARLRSMTPAQVAARLDDRFRLLRSGSRTALPRHQTLRAVVEWSWDLLAAPERALWRRLAIFPGGATLEAAERVCAGGDLDRDEVMDVLAALVDKSLVVLADADAPHGPRYRMLETIRAYGLERLAEAGEEERFRLAHAGYFAALAEEAEPHLYRHEQLDWLARLAGDQDNLHAALRWATARRNAPLAVRFCAALGWYWFLTGRFRESGESVEAALALPDPPADHTTALALAIAAITAMDNERRERQVADWLVRADRICADLGGVPPHPVLRLMTATLGMYLRGWDEESMSLADRLITDPDPWLSGLGHFVRGQMDHNFGRTEGLERRFAAARHRFREAGDRWGLSFALTALAEERGRHGDHHAAIALYEEALRLNDLLGGGAVAVLQNYMKLANELDLVGERDRALRLLETALRDTERVGSREGTATVHFSLGLLALRSGDLAEAGERLARAEGLVSAAPGPPQFRAMVRLERGRLALAAGDAGTARSRLAGALRDAVRALDYPIVAEALTGHAALALHEGDPVRAAELLGNADGLRGGRDLSQPESARLEERLRATLSEAGFAAAHARGHGRSFDETAALFGLERPAPPTAPVSRGRAPAD
ncbi:BTAD domain-containing putative transcriptional regulator [Actinomadura namibiensis]|uniref:Putative ATPase/DNA-binding SARP family transcriptional activator n=1 Tax=Actinomadura namibiensis TaxID=182080 RepID=A0A7W3QLV3_ACTNM|nr:BTAD domain-containing putative transcriptional regulator [Actinomadura namibiensis]MBA8951910.1 putative ATPase/DNA-binding SARP family transcriptional activator [Actinomadura namibiensis]